MEEEEDKRDVAVNNDDIAVPNDIQVDSLVVNLQFHPNKDVIAAGTIDGDVLLWSSNLESKNNELMKFTHHKKSCRALKFSADGELLFTCSKDKSLQVVDLNSGSIMQKIDKAHSCPPYSLEVIDNYLVATGDDDGTVKVWDFRRANAIMELKQMEEYVSSLVIANDKKILLATSGEGTLSAFNVRARRLELQSELFDSEFLCAALIKNDRKLAVGCGDGVINIFNWGEWGNISDRFPGHPLSVDCLVKVNDNLICTGSSDGKIRAVSILPNQFVGIVGQHQDLPIESLALSNDSHLLASCSHDQTIKFWHIEFLHSIEVQHKKGQKSQGKKHLQSSKGDFFSGFAEEN